MAFPLSPASTSPHPRLDPGSLDAVALFSRINLLNVALAGDPTSVSFLSALDAVDLDFSRLSPSQGLLDTVMTDLMTGLRRVEMEALMRRGLDVSGHARRQAGGGLAPYHWVLASDAVDKGLRTEQEMERFLVFLSTIPLTTEGLDDAQQLAFVANRVAKNPALYWQRRAHLKTLLESQAEAQTLEKALPGAHPGLAKTPSSQTPRL
jgi:hypothetical protein